MSDSNEITLLGMEIVLKMLNSSEIPRPTMEITFDFKNSNVILRKDKSSHQLLEGLEPLAFIEKKLGKILDGPHLKLNAADDHAILKITSPDPVAKKVILTEIMRALILTDGVMHPTDINVF
ncbi:hypothetical protein BMS3Abin15_01001 [bacterium BMS3Abin15]|nr:hypothetical protein BMS3Abin15_01001 [bacterium BMS3Abin15]HDH07760.1 hypothetical protein [Candidatus Moranbacteria bacterium]HDZ85235.1 hypothetical protein [Candidatus Moranbacteria bacterium]